MMMDEDEGNTPLPTDVQVLFSYGKRNRTCSLPRGSKSKAIKELCKQTYKDMQLEQFSLQYHSREWNVQMDVTETYILQEKERFTVLQDIPAAARVPSSSGVALREMTTEGELPRKKNSSGLLRKRSCVKRAISGYNLFCREKSLLPEMKALSTKDRLGHMARDWKTLTAGERGAFRERAKDTRRNPANTKREAKKSLKKLAANINHLKTIDDDLEVFFVCVGGTHARNTCGGTEGGQDFLNKTHLDIVQQFSKFVEADKAAVAPPPTRSVPARDIRRLFNTKYAAAIGKNGKMPYSTLKEKGITMEGIPDGLPIRRPGEYGMAQRRKIWAARKSLKCIINA